VGATIVVGGPAAPATGAGAWLPADGHRVRFAEPGNPDIKFSEWSQPTGLSLLQSALAAYPYWLTITDLDAVSTQYARLHTVQAGPDGTGTGLSDSLWTLGADGARAAIEADVTTVDGASVLDVSVLVPGRLDLPSDVAAGDSWVSDGTAQTWDATTSAFVASPYRATYRATTPADPGLATRGCLDVAMEQQTGDKTRTLSRTWCPGDGIVSLTDSTGTWAPTTAGPPVQMDAADPFDWSTADSLGFTPRTINHADVPGSLSLSPVSPPGLLNGGAVFAEQVLPDVHGVSTTEDMPQAVWAVRPGGKLTASATLGGVTMVATTNRQLVAYNNEGRWLWEAQLSDLVVVPPVRFGERVVVVALDGSVTALDPKSGAVAWRTDLGAELRNTPVVAGDRLLVANQAGALACIDANGRTVWVQDVGVPRSMAASSGPDPVVVYGENGSVVLRAYSLADGHQVWRQRVYQTPRDLISLDSALVLRDDSAVLGIDWSTGAVMWRWAGQRTAAGIGGGQRALLLGDTDFVLLAADGQPVRTWPHDLVDVTSHTTYLVAAGKTVLAYSDSGLEIGVVP